jgi:dTDP-4-dehydrorhamnose reductase
LVFSGLRDGGYCEDDPIDPVTMYGKTMAEGEKRVLEADPSATVFRISLPMGVSLSGHAGAIDWITSRFKKGRPATLYIDELRTPTYTDCMNRLYEVALGRHLPGLFHAGGPRRLTLYQIGQIINRVGGYDPDTLHGIPRLQAGPIPPRAGNVCMDSSKLIVALGYDEIDGDSGGPFDPWPWHDDLVPTDDDWHRRREPGEEGSPAYLHAVLCRNPRRVAPDMRKI